VFSLASSPIEMLRRLLVSILVALGLALLVVGHSWNWLFPPSAYWSEQQAAEYVAAHDAVHAAQDLTHLGESPDADTLDAAHERFFKIRRELEHARTARARSGKALTVVGLLIIVTAGLIQYYWPRSNDEMSG